MAKIKLGLHVFDMRGKVGNMVYSIWKSGMNVIKLAAQTVANPCSEKQIAVRNALSALAKVWKTLTSSQQTLWENLAQTRANRTNPEGGIRVIIRTPEGKFTGFNAFVEANSLARTVGASADIVDAQLATPAPNSPPTLAASYDGTKITVTWGDIPGVMPSQFVRVWLFSEQKLVHKQMVDFAPGAAKTMNITTVNGAKGGAIDIAVLQGTAMLIQADTIDQATGWASNPSRTLRLMLTPPTP